LDKVPPEHHNMNKFLYFILIIGLLVGCSSNKGIPPKKISGFKPAAIQSITPITNKNIKPIFIVNGTITNKLSQRPNDKKGAELLNNNNNTQEISKGAIIPPLEVPQIFKLSITSSNVLVEKWSSNQNINKKTSQGCLKIIIYYLVVIVIGLFGWKYYKFWFGKKK